MAEKLSIYDNIKGIECDTGRIDINGNKIMVSLLEAINTYEKLYKCKWIGCMESDEELVFRYQNNSVQTLWQDKLIKIVSRNE